MIENKNERVVFCMFLDSHKKMKKQKILSFNLNFRFKLICYYSNFKTDILFLS